MTKMITKKPRLSVSGIVSLIASPIFGSVVAVGSAVLLTVLIILVNSPNPERALNAFFLGPWSSAWFFGNTLDLITLLLTGSLGAVIAFRGGTFNLGGEGQIYLGGLMASVVLLLGRGWPAAVNEGAFPAPLLLTLAALAAMITGGLMGGFSGLLKKRLGMNELISSFLLSSALMPVGDFLIRGPWRDQTGNLLALPSFPNDLRFFRILPPSNLSVTFFFALLLVLCGHVFINRTLTGYKFRISGAAPDFARFGGLDPEKAWIPAMFVSGALFALTGFFAVAGTYGRCHAGFTDGLGWSAIAVALISRNRPLALLPATLVLGWLYSGSGSALLAAGLNLETSSLIQAVVLLFVTMSFGLPALKRRIKPGGVHTGGSYD